MATSDRTQWKQTLVGVLGASRTVSNSSLVVAQDAQRFDRVDVGLSATTATTDYVFPVAYLDRPVKITSLAIIPGGAVNSLNGVAGNYVTVAFGYTNANGGAMTNFTIYSTNTNAVANGGTGNWTTGIPIVPATNTWNANVNTIVPSGSLLQVTTTHTGAAGMAIPAGTSFQMVWEEV